MSTGALLLNSSARPEDPDLLLKQYGGKNELATEFDSCVAGLCLCLEGVFLHGLRTKSFSSQNQVNSALKQVSDIVAQSLHIRQESIAFWTFVENHLTNHENERFNILKNIWTDIGKCKAWVRSALNEKSLERYFHIVLSDKLILKEHYESWALLRDEDRNSMLPNMAAGLGSILFAISIDKVEFNTSIVPRPMLVGHREEPVIKVPIPDRKDNKSRRKVARQIISFDEDDSMLSTSVPSISSSSTCSDSSSIGKQRLVEDSDSKKTMDNKHAATNSIPSAKDAEKPKTGRQLSIENSGSREKFSSNVPGSLTPINQNSIGEESPDTSDDILEVPTDISAVLTVVENRNQEEIKRRDDRIVRLSKENEALKNQLTKYMSAIQMLKRDDQGMHQQLDGIEAESPPDYKDEAKMYEQKLIQVAEMHAELMDFNVMLQKTLLQKDTVLDRLKREFEALRGPMSVDELEYDAEPGCVNVWIPSAFLTGSGSNSHHVYQIFLRVGNDEWNIYRRYAQFHALHSDLKKLDPAVSTFDFPPKKSIGKKESSLVEERRKRLQMYLRRVIAHWPELTHCRISKKMKLKETCFLLEVLAIRATTQAYKYMFSLFRPMSQQYFSTNDSAVK
ncbi:hypothetical protein YQE_08021, partial [Dendroctonus ponderosae]